MDGCIAAALTKSLEKFKSKTKKIFRKREATPANFRACPYSPDIGEPVRIARHAKSSYSMSFMVLYPVEANYSGLSTEARAGESDIIKGSDTTS